MGLRRAVDNLCLYDPEFEMSGARFLADHGGSSAAHAVRSRDDLITAVGSYSNVKFLEIILHGTSGMIVFADKGGMRGQNLGAIAQGQPFVERNARILFDNCEIGYGERGDIFMDELGASLLRGRGGIIGATTVANVVLMPKSFFCSNIYMRPFSDGQLKVRRYDSNGKRVAEQIVDRHGNIQQSAR